MNDLTGCQIPSLARIAVGPAVVAPQPILRRVKRTLAVPWNYYVKRWGKKVYHAWSERMSPASVQKLAGDVTPGVPFQEGDWVRVRSHGEITSTLDPFHELKGCAFLEEMYQYCGTRQRVFKIMQRFLDERDYKVKKVRGVVLLEHVICQGTPVFGACDRCCFLFWRQEWLEKIERNE